MDLELLCLIGFNYLYSHHCMLLITDTPKELQHELNEFTNVLIHAESHMRKTIAENVQVCGNSHPH